MFSVTVGPDKPASGFAEDGGAQSEGVSDLQEAVSLKERMERYQAAVSRGDCRSFSANVSCPRWFCTGQWAFGLPFTYAPSIAIQEYHWAVG